MSDYKPDGGYIPRILFAEASRRLRPDVKNVKNPKHAYFYRNVEEVKAGMRLALDQFGLPKGQKIEL